MDNSSGGGLPTPPPSPAAAERQTAEQQFTVPVPTYSAPTQSLPMTGAPASGPWSSSGPTPLPLPADPPRGMPYAVSTPPPQGPSDAESLRTLSLVLLGIAIGFWVFVGIRVLNHIVEVGATNRLLIETIDQTFVETVAAAIVTVLAFAAALGSRLLAGRTIGGPLVWGTGALAVSTIVTAIWRVV